MKPVHHFVQNFFPGVPMLPKMLTKNVNKENVNKKNFAQNDALVSWGANC